MKKATIFLIIIIGLLNVDFAVGQNPFGRFKMENWNTKNGMPNDLILNVYQTKDGYIWTTSYTGLNRFDGVTFAPYNSRTVPLMKTDNIEGLLFETNDSTLWIPTPNSGLLSFKNGVFKSYLTDSNTLFIRDITKTEELLLSIGRGKNQSYGLFNTVTKTFTPITYSETIEILKLGEKNSYSRTIDQSGNKWIYFDRTFYKYYNGKLDTLTPKKEFYPDRGYYQIYPDSRNRVWLVATKGLFLWDGSAFKPYPGMEDVLFIGSGGASTGMLFEDTKGGIWAGTGNGVAYLPPQSDRFVFYPKNENLLSQNVNSFMEDNEGNIWFTSVNGLIKLSESKFINYSERDGLNDNRIAAVCALDDQHYFVATYAKLFTIDDGIVKPYRFKNKSLENFTGDPSLLLRDSEDNVWLCFTSGNIIRISKTGEKLFQPKSGVQTRYAFEDEKGQMYFGFAYGGIGYINQNDQLEMLSFPKIDFKSIYISSIRKLHNANWLVTTFNKGILIIDPQGNPTYYDDKSGLPTIGVFSSYEDPDGTIWITSQSGITRFKNGKFDNLDFRSGLPENSLFKFLPDQEGYVWFPSNRGLIRAKKQELNDYLDQKTDKINWQLYDDGDGMLDRQCVGARHPSITPDGRLLFATFGGLVEVDPRQLKQNMVSPPVKIHKVLKDDIDMELNQNQTFKPGNHRYIFQYSGLSFVAPEKVQFKFKLNGYDKDWILAKGDRKAFYTNLPSGKYTFQVIASNNDDVWNNIGASYSFRIAPYFYETAGFRILAFVFLLLLIWMIIRWRTRAAWKQNELLEAEVASRTNDLNKANSDISQSLENLKATQSQLIQSEKMASLGELTAGIAHEIQNPLNFVNNFSEVNRELLVEMKDELKKGNLDEVNSIADDVIGNEEKINHHGKRADAIVKGMLQHSRTSTGQKELTDINALADEYLRLSYHGLRAKDKSFNADFKTELDESLPKINVIPQDIGRVLLNLINNAFYAVDKRAKSIAPLAPKGGIKNDQIKYEPTVTVSTTSLNPPSGGRGVRVAVKDNGNGIPAAILDKIFQPFFTTKPTGQGTGLGLSLSYDIVKAHGGEITVESIEGEGTEFIIQIPLTN